jgi:hypothetical protein
MRNQSIIKGLPFINITIGGCCDGRILGLRTYLMRLQPQSLGAPTWRFASFHLRFLEFLDDRPRCVPVAHLRPRVVISARLVNAQRAHTLAMCIRESSQ